MAIGAAVRHHLVRAVGRVGHTAVVTRGQDLLVLYQHRARGPAVAGAPGAHQLGDEHEIFIPGWSHELITHKNKLLYFVSFFQIMLCTKNLNIF